MPERKSALLPPSFDPANTGTSGEWHLVQWETALPSRFSVTAPSDVQKSLQMPADYIDVLASTMIPSSNPGAASTGTSGSKGIESALP